MRVATDIGGTFTDLVAVDDQGEDDFDKESYDAAEFRRRSDQGHSKERCMPAGDQRLIHGTTTIINALTERKGAKTALITTKGFRDVLEIARCNRPDLFNMVFAKPRPFIPRYLRKEVEERVSFDGKIVTL